MLAALRVVPSLVKAEREASRLAKAEHEASRLSQAGHEASHLGRTRHEVERVSKAERRKVSKLEKLERLGDRLERAEDLVDPALEAHQAHGSHRHHDSRPDLVPEDPSLDPGLYPTRSLDRGYRSPSRRWETLEAKALRASEPWDASYPGYYSDGMAGVRARRYSASGLVEPVVRDSVMLRESGGYDMGGVWRPSGYAVSHHRGIEYDDVDDELRYRRLQEYEDGLRNERGLEEEERGRRWRSRMKWEELEAEERWRRWELMTDVDRHRLGIFDYPRWHHTGRHHHRGSHSSLASPSTSPLAAGPGRLRSASVGRSPVTTSRSRSRSSSVGVPDRTSLSPEVSMVRTVGSPAAREYGMSPPAMREYDLGGAEAIRRRAVGGGLYDFPDGRAGGREWSETRMPLSETLRQRFLHHGHGHRAHRTDPVVHRSHYHHGLGHGHGHGLGHGHGVTSAAAAEELRRRRAAAAAEEEASLVARAEGLTLGTAVDRKSRKAILSGRGGGRPGILRRRSKSLPGLTKRTHFV